MIMEQIKSYLSVIGIVAVAVGITYLIMSFRAESRIDYVKSSYQQKLDSTAVVARNARQSREQIADSLESLDKDFSEYVLRTNQKISSYTTIIGRLRIEKDDLQDSLSERQSGVFLGDLFGEDHLVTKTFKDTLVSRTNTWSDSLFATKAIAEFSGDSLYLDSELRALRLPRIDIATTVADDGSQVNTFVRSLDFDSLNVRSVTEVEAEKTTLEKAAPYTTAVAVILMVREAIKLIFK